MPATRPTFLRVLQNDGLYPSFRVKTGRHVLESTERITWSAVRQVVRQPQNLEGELAWLWPEEIRLYAAVSLVEPYPELDGRYRLHPWTEAVRMEGTATEAPFGSDAFFEIANQQALELSEKARHSEYYLPQRPHPYNLGSFGTSEHVSELIGMINVRDPLLMRGLSRFLAANHLIGLLPFMEEAAVTGYISLEAALEYLRQHLERESGEQKAFRDVFAYIRATFPTGEPFADVLEDDYEARIIMIHPASRFGEYWTPPVFAEETYDLPRSLIYLYRHILLGDIWDPDSRDTSTYR